ncbi:glycosyl transferase [Croceicoccus sp. Ery5]|uniref:glycosyl transferase n=1 Tax=Croceicoccus sp. Ery5 TaxID=1703340 RepID=UPI001E653C34|nr:glycosyl transferase [Croceicoccus sp. Ery5]
MTATIHVPAIGGAHQFLHFLPVAFELAATEGCIVRIFAPSAADADRIADLAEQLGTARPEIWVMDLPPPLAAILPRAAHKVARLLLAAGRIRDCDAILCAERTSTMLKRMPGRCPPLLHIPHGAGDRAVGFEDRFRLFDKVFVAGDKDRHRLIAQGCATPENCVVGGPVKLAEMMRIAPERPPLFPDDRPVILYNPHFHRRMGTGEVMARRLADAVCESDRYNLVIAPHVRMAQGWGEDKKARWQALDVAGRVMVDLGSARSVDMSYTAGAALYIGDVSSQVYEYLVRPRPCLFVNGHHAAWRGNPDYAMWRFGPVIEPDDDPVAAIQHAFDSWPDYAALQQERARAAFGGIVWDADGNARFAGPDPCARIARIIAADARRSGQAWPDSGPRDGVAALGI